MIADATATVKQSQSNQASFQWIFLRHVFYNNNRHTDAGTNLQNSFDSLPAAAEIYSGSSNDKICYFFFNFSQFRRTFYFAVKM